MLGTITILDTTTWGLSQSLWSHRGGIYGVALASDNDKLLTGSYDETAVVQSIKQRKC